MTIPRSITVTSEKVSYDYFLPGPLTRKITSLFSEKDRKKRYLDKLAITGWRARETRLWEEWLEEKFKRLFWIQGWVGGVWQHGSHDTKYSYSFRKIWYVLDTCSPKLLDYKWIFSWMSFVSLQILW